MATKKTPVQEYLAEIGKKGGSAKVPKGLSTLSPAERKKRAQAGALARWGPKKAGAKKGKQTK